MKKLTIVLGILLTFGLLFSSCSNGSKDDSGSSGNNTNNNSGNNNNTGNNNTGNNNGNTDWSWLIGTWEISDASGESEITLNGKKTTHTLTKNNLAQNQNITQLGNSMTINDSNLSVYISIFNTMNGTTIPYNAEQLNTINELYGGQMTFNALSMKSTYTVAANKLSFSVTGETNQDYSINTGSQLMNYTAKSTYTITYTKK